MPSLNHSPPRKQTQTQKLILIGSSTGGPGHLQKILTGLVVNFSASLVIAQHMGREYIPSFVNQLQSQTSLDVMAVEDGMFIESNKVYICSLITRLVSTKSGIKFQQSNSNTVLYNPDINQLFDSAALITRQTSVMGIILTGVGDDGAIGCKRLSEAGGYCIAEDESSAIVFGMPRQAKLLSDKIAVKNLGDIISSINRFGG